MRSAALMPQIPIGTRDCSPYEVHATKIRYPSLSSNPLLALMRANPIRATVHYPLRSSYLPPHYGSRKNSRLFLWGIARGHLDSPVLPFMTSLVNMSDLLPDNEQPMCFVSQSCPVMMQSRRWDRLLSHAECYIVS